MPKLKIEIPHDLTQQEALNRIQQFLPELKAKHSEKISDLQETWSGNTGSFKFKLSGFIVSGSLIIENHFVLIKGEIPWMAAPLKGKIENTIKQHAEILLK